MNGLGLWLGLAGGEVLLVIFVLLLVYWIRHSSAARRDRRAVAQLVARARKDKAQREAAVHQFLSEGLGLEGHALEREKITILREEYRLLQTFAEVYGGRDANRAAQFQISVEAAMSPYLALRASGSGAASGMTDDSELEALREENARLTEELSVTMDTMARILSDYSNMFSGGGTVDAAFADAVSEDKTDVAARTAETVEDEPLSGREVSDLEEEALDIAEAPEDPSAEEAVAEAVMDGAVPDAGELDDLFEGDPLEESLGDLFDEDEMAALDEEESVAREEDDAIAI